MSVLFICTMCMQLSTEVRGLDPLGGVRGGCETLDVGAGYGTWPSVRVVIGIND